MKKSTLTQSINQSINTDSITVQYAEPFNVETPRTIIIREKVVTKENSLSSTLILAAGILFWAHGSASNDAWFKGEEVTGQAITGFYIALVGIICCCGCVALCAAAADSNDSEIKASLPEASRANRFLINNAGLFQLADKKIEESNGEENSNIFQV